MSWNEFLDLVAFLVPLKDRTNFEVEFNLRWMAPETREKYVLFRNDENHRKIFFNLAETTYPFVIFPALSEYAIRFGLSDAFFSIWLLKVKKP